MRDDQSRMSPDEGIGVELGLAAGRTAALALKDAIDLCQNDKQAEVAVVGAIIKLAQAACEAIPDENSEPAGPLRQADLLATVARQMRTAAGAYKL